MIDMNISYSDKINLMGYVASILVHPFNKEKYGLTSL